MSYSQINKENLGVKYEIVDNNYGVMNEKLVYKNLKYLLYLHMTKSLNACYKKVEYLVCKNLKYLLYLHITKSLNTCYKKAQLLVQCTHKFA